ncbi:MAG: tetratricopeptide repeat protein [Candidatus Andersenbacteria bacterium]
MKRRNRKQLEARVAEAKTQKDKARTYYELALFHDNNSREKEAIPYYRKAIALGLDQKTKGEAYAWLASSLYKANQTRNSLKYIKLSRDIAQSKKLNKFLDGLEKRIKGNK